MRRLADKINEGQTTRKEKYIRRQVAFGHYGNI
jgi:hypothetical protein